MFRQSPFLGAFAKMRKVTVSFVMYVHLFAWSDSAPTGRIFMKFNIYIFFRNSVEKIRDSLKSDKNNVRVLYMKPNIHFGSHLALLFLELKKKVLD